MISSANIFEAKPFFCFIRKWLKCIYNIQIYKQFCTNVLHKLLNYHEILIHLQSGQIVGKRVFSVIEISLRCRWNKESTIPF